MFSWTRFIIICSISSSSSVRIRQGQLCSFFSNLFGLFLKNEQKSVPNLKIGLTCEELLQITFLTQETPLFLQSEPCRLIVCATGVTGTAVSLTFAIYLRVTKTPKSFEQKFLLLELLEAIRSTKFKTYIFYSNRIIRSKCVCENWIWSPRKRHIQKTI